MNHRPGQWLPVALLLLVISCAPGTRYFSTLKNSDVELRREAAFQLSILDRIAPQHLPQLLDAAEDDDAVVREFSIKAIGKMDPKLEGVPQAIRRGLRDRDLSVRRTSAAIFSSMNPVPSEVLVTLAEALNDNDSLLRSYVKSTFIDLGPIGVNALLQICRRGDPDLRCRALSTLGTIGCEAKRALPALRELLADENNNVRNAAQQSIDLIQLAYRCPGASER